VPQNICFGKIETFRTIRDDINSNEKMEFRSYSQNINKPGTENFIRLLHHISKEKKHETKKLKYRKA
jgi:hypothetical protein